MARIIAAPAFGEADLSNCEREQIHLAGSIQPHGALLVLSEPDLVVVQASDNAAALLGAGRRIVGLRLAELPGDLLAGIKPRLRWPLDQIPALLRCRGGTAAGELDALVHRPPDGGVIAELEPAGLPLDLSSAVETSLKTIIAAPSLRSLCDGAARLFRELTGYDRVMVYRFDDEGHGEVFAEERLPELEPYLGNRYPASDIPQIARRLYMRNRVRVLVDIGYIPVPVRPARSPLSGRELDMSLCSLRSISPIHVQYLRNMGVTGTLVASLVVGGRLWGLVACHHYAPRRVPYEIRAACELLAESMATRITALESFARAQAELSVRRIEQRMIDAIARDGDWRTALFDSSQPLLQPLAATGAALLLEGQVLSGGDVPSTRQLRELGQWLDERRAEPALATASLSLDAPRFEALKEAASGLLAVPVSTLPGEYLMWFRPERVRTVTWGGDPAKAVEVGADPSQLSPRRSFAQWHQLVEGTSDPWTQSDLGAARLIGESVADMVLQFRSVRMLIARDQLGKVSGQVSLAGQPVLLADASGTILLANEAFTELLRPGQALPERLPQLADLFVQGEMARRHLHALVSEQRSWRGEVEMSVVPDERLRLQVRADPVLSAPRRLLGFVLLLTDLTERQAVETARRRFQSGIVEQHRMTAVRLDSHADLIYRNLLSTVIGNAQLAALEITDGVDLARMPEMLESVHVSVTRSKELLEYLIWRSTRSTGH